MNQLLARVSDGLVVTTATDGCQAFVEVNRGFVALTGYRREELIGRDYCLLTGPATDSGAMRRLRTALLAGKACETVVLHYRKDGTPFWHQIVLAPLRDAEAKTVCFVGVHREADRPTERAGPIRDDSSEAGGISTTDGEHSESAHEVRGALATILSFVHLLRDSVSDPSHIEWLDTIARNGELCVELLRHSSVPVGVVAADPEMTERLTRERSVVDLRGRTILVVDDHVDVRAFVREVLERAGARVLAVEDGTVAVQTVLSTADRGDTFDLVLMDLQIPGKSGIDATRELRSRGYEGRLFAYSAAAAHEVVDRCLEAGCDAYVPKTVDASRLVALVQNCFDPNGAPDEADASQPTSGSTRPAMKRVLIVDDNADTVKALTILLERAGHETRAAMSGGDAIAVSERFFPEVALIDLRLPDMDGHTLVGRLREQTGLLTAFAVSGFDSPSQRQKANEAGFDRYFVKPVDFAELERAISS